MAREDISTANFGPKAQARSNISQALTKGKMDRERFARRHQGGVGRNTEYRAEENIEKSAARISRGQLLFLKRLEQKMLERRGQIPKFNYLDLQEMYYRVFSERIHILSADHAKEVYRELVDELEKHFVFN